MPCMSVELWISGWMALRDEMCKLIGIGMLDTNVSLRSWHGLLLTSVRELWASQYQSLYYSLCNCTHKFSQVSHKRMLICLLLPSFLEWLTNWIIFSLLTAYSLIRSVMYLLTYNWFMSPCVITELNVDLWFHHLLPDLLTPKWIEVSIFSSVVSRGKRMYGVF
jgi:hypothetical protein